MIIFWIGLRKLKEKKVQNFVFFKYKNNVIIVIIWSTYDFHYTFIHLLVRNKQAIVAGVKGNLYVWKYSSATFLV